jgi:hypothetical protein
VGPMREPRSREAPNHALTITFKHVGHLFLTLPRVIAAGRAGVLDARETKTRHHLVQSDPRGGPRCWRHTDS